MKIEHHSTFTAASRTRRAYAGSHSAAEVDTLVAGSGAAATCRVADPDPTGWRGRLESPNAPADPAAAFCGDYAARCGADSPGRVCH
jgi:hypothetical protein